MITARVARRSESRTAERRLVRTNSRLTPTKSTACMPSPALFMNSGCGLRSTCAAQIAVDSI